MYPEALSYLHWENSKTSCVPEKNLKSKNFVHENIKSLRRMYTRVAGENLDSTLDNSLSSFNFPSKESSVIMNKSAPVNKLRRPLSKPSSDIKEANNNEKRDVISTRSAGLQTHLQRMLIRTPMKSKLEPSHNPGQIPDYLVKKREEEARTKAWVEAQKLEGIVPPGHKKLPEEERVETLNLLKEAYVKTLSQLNHMPLRNDTQMIRTRREVLEKRLVEIEENISIFSKPKVFIKIDDINGTEKQISPKDYETTLG